MSTIEMDELRQCLAKQFAEIDTLKATIANMKDAEKVFVERIQKAEGQLDMMKDEFERIKAAPFGDTDEVRGICDRAILCITQHVPIIQQRDNWEQRARKAEACAAEMRGILEHGVHFLSYEERLNHALSTSCGVGWLSPEKVKELEERCRAAEQAWYEMVEKVEKQEAEIQRCYTLLYGMRCVYCGEVVGAELKNQTIGDEMLRAHVEQCTKHPAFILKQQNQLMRDALELSANHWDGYAAHIAKETLAKLKRD